MCLGGFQLGCHDHGRTPDAYGGGLSKKKRGYFATLNSLLMLGVGKGGGEVRGRGAKHATHVEYMYMHA